jgi:hypothetical protein
MAENKTVNDSQDPCSAVKLKVRCGWIAKSRTGYALEKVEEEDGCLREIDPYPRMRVYTRVGVRDEGSGTQAVTVDSSDGSAYPFFLLSVVGFLSWASHSGFFGSGRGHYARAAVFTLFNTCAIYTGRITLTNSFCI